MFAAWCGAKLADIAISFDRYMNRRAQRKARQRLEVLALREDKEFRNRKLLHLSKTLNRGIPK